MRVAAVDLGATSVRVATVELGAAVAEPVVVHRWPHGPVAHRDGSLRWDWDGIVREVRTGLDLALEIGPLASIAVDGWGVDYGLLDGSGRLLSPPYSYRDRRTETWSDVAERLGADRLYEATGIQLMAINTIFQLAVHDRGELDAAARLLLLPDLLLHDLCGHVGAERSNASTTALLDASASGWSTDLLSEIDVSPSLLPDLHDAPERVGTYRGVPVHLVGSHDTASAVVALPGEPGSRAAFVSSGTWVLVGAERPKPDTSQAARTANFSNERGALGGVRFLRNVMGFWMLEQCRSAWGSPSVPDLVAAAAAQAPPGPLVDATDERFLAPADMEAEVRAAAGLGASATVAAVTRCILESIAAATADVVDRLASLTGDRVSGLHVVGGAARLPFMNELYARHSGLPVHVGSSEATALGNALVQGIALGRFSDLADARRAIASAAATD